MMLTSSVFYCQMETNLMFNIKLNCTLSIICNKKIKTTLNA